MAVRPLLRAVPMLVAGMMLDLPARAAPPADANDLFRRVLALIGTIKRPGDLTAERAARMTGVALRPLRADAAETMTGDGVITAEWSYRLTLSPQPLDKARQALRVELVGRTPGTWSDIAPVCVADRDVIATLERLGFDASRTPHPYVGYETRGFSGRGKPAGDLTITYAKTPPHRCVTALGLSEMD